VRGGKLPRASSLALIAPFHACCAPHPRFPCLHSWHFHLRRLRHEWRVTEATVRSLPISSGTWPRPPPKSVSEPAAVHEGTPPATPPAAQQRPPDVTSAEDDGQLPRWLRDGTLLAAASCLASPPTPMSAWRWLPLSEQLSPPPSPPSPPSPSSQQEAPATEQTTRRAWQPSAEPPPSPALPPSTEERAAAAEFEAEPGAGAEQGAAAQAELMVVGHAETPVDAPPPVGGGPSVGGGPCMVVGHAETPVDVSGVAVPPVMVAGVAAAPTTEAAAPAGEGGVGSPAATAAMAVRRQAPLPQTPVAVV
jgi:hypothetical protein